ncbi:nitroreductase/quinone reductase family protein [Nocardia sp. NPDC058058]|uniref:nitroreductase/quinone reductase family protein n=1 Tax=Nocardia sp. NPDC058058 TaxID=3346317 RepID=UPI0036DD680A
MTPHRDPDPAAEFYSTRRPIRTAGRKALVAIASRRWSAIFFRQLQPRMDRGVYRLTRGRYSTMTLFTGLLLTVTGRRTGRSRSVPLLYIEHDGRIYVTGSNGGQDNHPEWTANLLADPMASITLRGRRVAVRARLLEGDERDRVWPVLTAIWPPYDVHTARSGRTLRVFELEQLGSAQ